MTIERYSKISSYALVLISFVMLAATQRLDTATIGGFALTMLAAALLDARPAQAWRRSKWWRWVWLSYLPFLGLEYNATQGISLLSFLRFTLLIVAVRLLREKSDRDWLLLYCLSFFQVMLAASLVLDGKFFALLLLYLLAGISALVSFEMRRAQREVNATPDLAQRVPAGAPSTQLQCAHAAARSTNVFSFWRRRRGKVQPLAPPRWRNIFVFSLVALALMAVLATPLFLALPRVQRPMNQQTGMGEALSGFSESVRLGDVGRIKLNPQVVMRTHVTWPLDQQRQPLRWRGAALHHYQDGVWSKADEPAEQLPQERGGFLLSRQAVPQHYTFQRITTDNLQTSLLFVAARPIWVSGIGNLSRDEGDALRVSHPLPSRTRYLAVSDTRLPNTEALRADNSRRYPLAITRRHLQLPTDFSPRARQLAAEIIGTNENQYESVLRAQEYLLRNYTYSLDLDRRTEGDPIDDFLFQTKAGHCEYFATALTLLLRAQGIPARLVNGFQMGQYSELHDVYLVRQSDAHSWTEVYFPEHGWVAFDPTPAAGLSNYAGNPLAWLRQYGDALQLFWQERVVSFDATEQLALLLAAQRKLMRWRSQSENRWIHWGSQLNHWLAAFAQPTPPTLSPAPDAPAVTTSTNDWWQRWQARIAFLLGSLAVVVAVLLWRKFGGWWRFAGHRDPAAIATAFYQDMLQALARLGHQRQLAQTPREFATQLGWPSVLELTALYQQARFSEQHLTPAETARVNDLLREIKRCKPNERPSASAQMN